MQPFDFGPGPELPNGLQVDPARWVLEPRWDVTCRLDLQHTCPVRGIPERALIPSYNDIRYLARKSSNQRAVTEDSKSKMSNKCIDRATCPY